jgi:hypothetical protein
VFTVFSVRRRRRDCRRAVHGAGPVCDWPCADRSTRGDVSCVDNNASIGTLTKSDHNSGRDRARSDGSVGIASAEPRPMDLRSIPEQAQGLQQDRPLVPGPAL